MNIRSPFNDDELVQGIKDNNSMVISYIYKKNYPTIANFIRLNGGNDDDAKDIFQESLITLFHKVQQENFSLTSKLNTYIYSIARNLWLTELKRKQKNTDDINEVEEFLPNDELLLDDIELIRQNQKRLMWSLEKLGEPCKSILSYFYFYQWSMQEIAEKMGYTNAENAKNQKYKCLLRLKKIYQKM
ncbi:MAG: sigma-70 family RNA polymerase sigma factor [Bacteroidales bacterium]|nr:sigma-70 family RNA polymerase sigma factor [Bacteroidales bacterium]